MKLASETKYGLTFGQIISLLTMFGVLVVAWVNINIRITEIQGQAIADRVRIEQLEQGRQANASKIEIVRTENRDDHKAITVKLDEVLKELRTK